MHFNAPVAVAPQPPAIPRNVLIASGVVVFHVLALWALQSGLLRRAVEVIVPVQLLAEFVTPPAPKPEPQSEAPAKTPPPKPTSTPPTPPVVTPQPAPTPLALVPSAVTPSATAVAPTNNAQNIESSTAATSSNSNKATNIISAPKTVDRSCVEANYIYNPKPPYPRLSNKLREEGNPMLRIFVGTDGVPTKIELQESSGFDRLDSAAINGVKAWRFRPCQVDGRPAEAVFDVPVVFNLQIK